MLSDSLKLFSDRGLDAAARIRFRILPNRNICAAEQSRLTFLTEDKGIGKQKGEHSSSVFAMLSEENELRHLAPRETFHSSDELVYLHAADIPEGVREMKSGVV